MTKPNYLPRGAVHSDATGLDVHFAVPFSYRVRFTSNVLEPTNRTLQSVIESDRDSARTLAFVDDGVAHAWPGLLAQIRHYATVHADVIHLVDEATVVPGGERAKNSSDVVDTVLRAIDAGRLCRHSYVLAIGGGAVIDAVGFAAATAHRGVRLIRLPTTTLAQADAAVGVKNGVNAFGKKNLLGCFAPPWAVVSDDVFLSTLSDRDWCSGFAEAIKVALLKDRGFFQEIETWAASEEHPDDRVATRIIRRTAELHIDHISKGGDPFELRSARPLDFGHWSGHKLEELSGFKLRHGEAVALGMALDTVVSMFSRGLSQGEAHRILACIGSVGLPLYNPLLRRTDALRQGLEQFREHLGGRLAITLLEAIGRPVLVNDFDFSLVTAGVDYLASYIPARTHASQGDSPLPTHDRRGSTSDGFASGR